MVTNPRSRLDPGAPVQDPALMAWARRNNGKLRPSDVTEPIMQRLMQMSPDPPAGLNELPARFGAPAWGLGDEGANLQGGAGADTLMGGTRSRYTLTARDVEAINTTSARLGIKPEDLTAVIHYETIGTMNPTIKGGKGGNYQGLIQFGPTERKAYGYNPAASFAEQVEGPVYRYLKDRGLQPGDDVGRIYRTINGGNRNAKLTKNDGNGTIAQHIARIKQDSLPAAQATLKAVPAGPNMEAIMDVAGRNTAPSAVPDQATAAMGFAPYLGLPPAQTAIADMLGAPPQAPLPAMPPTWASGSFPEAGGQGQDTMAGGTSPPMPRLRDQSVLDQQRADMLDEMLFGAGPHRGEYARGRPEGRFMGGGAPDASAVPMPTLSPLNPALGGPADRRPSPPMPTMRPEGRWMSGAGGAPDAGSVPNPPPRGTPYAPGFPDVFGEQPQRAYADASRSEAIQGIIDQGIREPSEIWGYLNMDGAGNLVGDISMEEIQSVLDRTPYRAPTAGEAIADEFGPGVPFPAPQPAQRVYADALDRFDMEAPAAMPEATPAPKTPPRATRETWNSMGLGSRGNAETQMSLDRDWSQPLTSAPPPPPNPYDDWTRQYDTPGPITQANERMGVFEGTPDPSTIAPPPNTPEVGNVNYPGPLPTQRLPQTQAAVSEPGMGLGPYGMTPPPMPLADARTKDDAYSPPAYVPDFNFAPMPSPFGPQAGAMTGEGAPSSGVWSQPGSGQWMTDDRPKTPAPPPAMSPADQFNLSFSPGGPGVIMDVPGRPSSPMPVPDLPFGAPAAFAGPQGDGDIYDGGPRASYAAELQGSMPQNFWDSPAYTVPPPNGIDPGRFTDAFPQKPLSAIQASVVQPAPQTPPPPADAEQIAPYVDNGPVQQTAAPPPLPEPAPPPTQAAAPPTNNRGIISRAGRAAAGLLFGPVGAAAGGLLGGFGTSATFSPFQGPGTFGSAPYNQQPNGQMGKTTYQHGKSGNMQGTMWNRSGGGSVGYVTDPFTGAMIYSASPMTF